MNLPNSISLFRIILVPVIIVIMLGGPQYYKYFDVCVETNNYELPIANIVAACLFIIAAISDWFDGYFARKLNQVTDFGKFFDAIADKLLINSVLIIMTVGKYIPVPTVIILVGRDFIIDIVRQILASKQVVMAADKLGKYRAATTMIGIIILFFLGHKPFTNHQQDWLEHIILIPIYLANVLSVVSCVNYIYKNRKNLFSIKNKRDDQ